MRNQQMRKRSDISPAASAPKNQSRGLNIVRRETLKERVYKEVRRALQDGRFEPGEAITVKSLAEELGGGTMPIRESLQRLVAEGALVNLANGRVRVPQFTAEEFDEIKEIRLRLEGLATYLSATRLDKAGMKEIEERYRALFRVANVASNWVQVTHTNYQFHFAIYEAAQSPYLTSIIDSLWLRVSPLLSIPFRKPARARNEYLTIHEVNHAKLIEAFREKDGRAAEAAMREIILASASWYHRHYQFATESLRAVTWR
jgi:DNA-binding GntR family transcriptional regulator